MTTKDNASFLNCKVYFNTGMVRDMDDVSHGELISGFMDDVKKTLGADECIWFEGPLTCWETGPEWQKVTHKQELTWTKKKAWWEVAVTSK